MRGSQEPGDTEVGSQGSGRWLKDSSRGTLSSELQMKSRLGFQVLVFATYGGFAVEEGFHGQQDLAQPFPEVKSFLLLQDFSEPSMGPVLGNSESWGCHT